MKFVYPWMLMLVALVPVAGAFWIFLRARAERRLARMVAPSLIARLFPASSGPLHRLQMPLMVAGLALVALAAARPQWGHSSQKFEARSRNVVVALDVSRSMLVADVRPNRLERAKADIADLVDSLEGDRCALVAFRRTGVLLCPLTTDHAFLRSALEGASPDSAARGETDLAAAIRTSLDALDPAADGHNAIILISDGGDLRGGALDAAGLARKRGVPVFTVGIGDPRRAGVVPGEDGKGVQQYKGQAVTAKLEDQTLAAIAKASGGRYVPLATAGTAETTLGAIYRRFLRQVAAKEQAEEEELRATERFGVFLVPGLLLMLLAGMLSRGRFAGRRRREAAALLAAMLAVFAVHAQAPAAAPAEDGGSAEDAATNAMAVIARDATIPSYGESQLTDGEVWNKGVDYWRSGDGTNALSTLRPLMLSRTHGARASEVVGAIRHGQMLAAAAEDPATAAAAAEEAASAMQIALRAAPEDQRAQRNFTRASDRVAELREAAHVKAVLAAAQGQGPDQQLGSAVQTARGLMKESAGVLTNDAPRALALSEAMSRQAAKLADVWIPIKEGVVQAMAQNATNQQQLAYAVNEIEAAREATKKAADSLADLDPAAQTQLAQAEESLNRFWKLTVMPPAAIAEGILAQTNAFIDAEKINGRAWQPEALDFTKAFRARFPAWAQQYEQQAQADTNKPPFTKEAQAEINALAGEVEKMQLSLLKAEDPPTMLDALRKLERIRELLPKDKNGGGQNNQQQNQDQQQNQNQDDKQQDKDKNKDQDKDGKQQDKQDQQQDQKQEEQKQSEEKKDQPPPSEDEVEALLQKAKDRNDQHENEKKARMRKVPPSPNERDW
ncbi:MAG: VWA domain-containing protein [Kiritimatiellae bacterium]|nr:VWA domain-containing protein [Kiritimatiellia bacterium]